MKKINHFCAQHWITIIKVYLYLKFILNFPRTYIHFLVKVFIHCSAFLERVWDSAVSQYHFIHIYKLSSFLFSLLVTYEITLSVNNDISFNITDTICKHSIVQNQAHEGNSILLQLLTFIKELALYKLFNPLKLYKNPLEDLLILSKCYSLAFLLSF